MEGPGGYQFVGRTVQVWNRDRRGPHFDQPWLLRPFDQLRFHPVDGRRAARAAGGAGRRRAGDLRSRRRRSGCADHRALPGRRTPTRSTRSGTRQQAAFDAERASLGSRAASRVSDRRRRRSTPSTAATRPRSPPTAATGIWITLVERETALGAAAATSTTRVAARRAPAAGRHHAGGEGQHRRRRPADDRRLPGLRRTTADVDAPAVAALVAAGAVVVGKTNLDQFATGLVGVRSPYGDLPERPLARPGRRRVELGLGGRRRHRAWSTSRSAPTPPGRAGCRRRATASSALKPTRGPDQHRRRRAGVPVARLRVGVRPLGRRSGARPSPSPPAAIRRDPWSRRAAPMAPQPDRPLPRRRPASTARRSTATRRAGALRAAVDGCRRARRRSSTSTSRRSSRPARCCTAGRSSPSATRPSARSSTPTPTTSTRSSARSSPPPGGCRRGRCSATGPSWPASRPLTAPVWDAVDVARRADRAAGADGRRGAGRADRRQRDARDVHQLREPARPVRRDACRSGDADGAARRRASR